MNRRLRVGTQLQVTGLVMLLSLCSLLMAPARSAQEEQEDAARRLWNKKFVEARADAKKTPAKSQTGGSTRPTATQPKTEANAVTPSGATTEVVQGELIGITLWRLRAATARDDQSKPRLLVQKDAAASGPYLPERVAADTPFKEGQFVRLSIEAPRENDAYLYVIDREVYADGKMGDPYLIFPAQSTPSGGNVVTAGKVIYVPAQGDPIPYFTLTRNRGDQVGESLTIIISPQPLPVGVGLLKLDPAQVAEWEKQWGGPTERREARSEVGKGWTVAEKEVEDSQGKRLLTQTDPLPQTIYRIAAKSGGPVLINVPLRIAPQ